MNMKMKMKIVAAVWFFVVSFVALSLFGCTANKLNFEPLPSEKPENLLFQEPLKNIAYKSVTEKDYKCEEEC